MVTSSAQISQVRQPDLVDLRALKARQQVAWSSGDDAVVGAATILRDPPPMRLGKRRHLRLIFPRATV
jgi:hypothetical protein